MSWYWKQKPTWRKNLTTYNSHPWIMFCFNWLVIIWRGRRVRLKLDVQGQGDGRTLEVGVVGGLENWTIFMDVICVSSLIKLLLAHSFREMFFIKQNLKFVHMTYSFLELLIYFWLTLVNIYCLEFISHYIKKILYINTNSKGN